MRRIVRDLKRAFPEAKVVPKPGGHYRLEFENGMQVHRLDAELQQSHEELEERRAKKIEKREEAMSDTVELYTGERAKLADMLFEHLDPMKVGYFKLAVSLSSDGGKEITAIIDTLKLDMVHAFMDGWEEEQAEEMKDPLIAAKTGTTFAKMIKWWQEEVDAAARSWRIKNSMAR